MQVTISGMEGTIPASWFSHLEIAIERSNPSLSARIKSLYLAENAKYRLFCCLSKCSQECACDVETA